MLRAWLLLVGVLLQSGLSGSAETVVCSANEYVKDNACVACDSDEYVLHASHVETSCKKKRGWYEVCLADAECGMAGDRQLSCETLQLKNDPIVYLTCQHVSSASARQSVSAAAITMSAVLLISFLT